MASRTWFSSALRQCQTTLFHPQPKAAPFSTSSRASALKDHASSAAKLSDLTRSSSRTPGDITNLLLDNSPAYTAKQQQKREDTERELAAAGQTDAYLRMMPRKWRKGDVYAPKDLSHVEAKRWRYSNPPAVDIVDMMGFNPVDNYRNLAMISEHMTAHGRIEHSKNSGLRPVNQRKMAKAIRRAIGMGLHPSVHLHPEILLNHTAYISHGTLPTTQLPIAAKATRFSRS
ncbi:hypothetical protein QBC34DRAFT_398376 [Podospora aff. communis PSN243]|uniref:Small ribosomal subunit protein bS18m n=1 Tax=Podospora aff. communis PSN243 TaxID=3040156 RepID=A0AAV9GWM5_9PEZI|nr:hypothetical protein QBC34DRAFT_398376 [Podospora aff. communis PSN243]